MKATDLQAAMKEMAEYERWKNAAYKCSSVFGDPKVHVEGVGEFTASGEVGRAIHDAFRAQATKHAKRLLDMGVDVGDSRVTDPLDGDPEQQTITVRKAPPSSEIKHVDGIPLRFITELADYLHSLGLNPETLAVGKESVAVRAAKGEIPELICIYAAERARRQYPYF